ncbi:uncharacterized protein LOC121934648 [Sceloporus undulatus]|uniref:uncharacterized protein LOC121934648 n=1 Tax=Sceloporus undulatus TaxID=8520 RepID=UPI001C4CCC42|nr:uncharacterized protein LOC121934648 [Sceloporus undulatus]
MGIGRKVRKGLGRLCCFGSCPDVLDDEPGSFFRLLKEEATSTKDTSTQNLTSDLEGFLPSSERKESPKEPSTKEASTHMLASDLEALLPSLERKERPEKTSIKDTSTQTLVSDLEALPPLLERKEMPQGTSIKEASTKTVMSDLEMLPPSPEVADQVLESGDSEERHPSTPCERPQEPEEPDRGECTNQRRAALDAKLRSSSGKEILHRICQQMPNYVPQIALEMANILAVNHLDLVIDHFFESSEKDCERMAHAVLCSPLCDVDKAIRIFLCKVTKCSCMFQETEEQVKAIRAVGMIIKHHSNVNKLKSWAPHFFAAFWYAMVVANRKIKEEETSGSSGSYPSPQEITEIVTTLFERTEMMHIVT